MGTRVARFIGRMREREMTKTLDDRSKNSGKKEEGKSSSFGKCYPYRYHHEHVWRREERKEKGPIHESY